MTEVTSGGTRSLIYNECWGIAATAGGFVVACGTGIENCNGKSGTELSNCQTGKGDNSHPTLRFGAGKWLSMVAKVSSDGTLLWQRADGHRDSEAVAYAGPGSLHRDGLVGLGVGVRAVGWRARVHSGRDQRLRRHEAERARRRAAAVRLAAAGGVADGSTTPPSQGNNDPPQTTAAPAKLQPCPSGRGSAASP